MLIGAGNLASEYAKSLSLLGFCTGPEGKLIIVDESKITKKDLYTYFPYRYFENIMFILKSK